MRGSVSRIVEAVPPEVPSAATETSGNSALAIAFLVAAGVVISISLFFAYWYHRRLLQTIEQGLASGQIGSLSSSESAAIETLNRRAGETGGLNVIGPNETTVGSSATFEVDPSATAPLSWTVEGADASPTTGSGTTFTTKFTGTGTATITAVDPSGNPSGTHATVVVAAAPATAGVSLPFVIRNWGRLVVTIFGVGVVAALLSLGTISGEGGIGLLGALLGVAAATANREPAVATPGSPPSDSDD